jgi:hypothetical protein
MAGISDYIGNGGKKNGERGGFCCETGEIAIFTWRKGWIFATYRVPPGLDSGGKYT